MKVFPEFWYESNAVFGSVKSVEDLKEKLLYQTDATFGAFKTKDDFLDRSKQHYNGTLNFGTRREHTGEKTLRQFLAENEIAF